MIGVTIDKDVRWREFWHHWDAIRNESQIHKVALIECECKYRSSNVGIYAERDMEGGLTKAMTSFAEQRTTGQQRADD